MKKAQVFTIDLAFGMLITIAALLSIVLFLPVNEEPFVADSERVNLLMTEGVPSQWNATTVVVSGFLTDERFNATKIDTFSALPVSTQKNLLGLQSDFTIRFFVNNTQLDLCLACGSAPASYDELLTIERYGLLEDNITTMEVRLYQ